MSDLRKTLGGFGARLLPRGESLIAAAGLAIAAILLVVLAAAGAHTMLTTHRAVEASARDHLRSLSDVIAGSTEILLARDEIATVRRLIVETGAAHGLARCRIVLPGGHVLADADPTRVSPGALESWVSDVSSLPPPVRAEGEIGVERALSVLGRGPARLELAVAHAPAVARIEAWAGLGLIGIAALLAVLAVYRRLRTRLRLLGSISDVLGALGAGESSPAVLSLDPSLGDGARAWNRLIEERAQRADAADEARAVDAVLADRSSAPELAQACDALWQGVVVVGPELDVRYVNGAGAVLMGMRREGATGAALASMVKDERVIEAVRGALEGRSMRRATIEARCGEGPGAGVLRYGVRSLEGSSARLALITIEDVTQQRIADDARNAFVAQATHELRTPLTNIRLYVEQALEEGDDAVAVRAKALNVINDESRRLERIVGDMLSVSEIEAGSLKLRVDNVELDTLFAQLNAEYAAQAAEKCIGLTFRLPPKWPVMAGDRDKLGLALHNLLGNALKYTPNGGRVTVAVEADESALKVEVSDTGLGIRDEEQDRIFEKFYRSRDERIAGIMGTGLGLALAREVARMHGGDITVRSKLDQGSTFTLTVPTRRAA